MKCDNEVAPNQTKQNPEQLGDCTNLLDPGFVGVKEAKASSINFG
jgi:hypothetical protein